MKRQLLLFLSLLFIFVSCHDNDEEHLVIAISRSAPVKSYGNYSKWVHRTDSRAQIVNMYELGVDSALQVLNNCDGLIVAGGADVYPEWYGKINDTAKCGAFDRYRDTLEIELIRKAITVHMPVLGICRGAQILNVSLGGDLIIDIPSDYDTSVTHMQNDWKNCFHQVHIDSSSYLFSLLKLHNGIVNSNHHQAVDQLSTELKIASVAMDGIIEAIEWKDKSDKGFLLGLQWHPERLDTVHPELSTPIIEEFLKCAKNYKQLK